MAVYLSKQFSTPEEFEAWIKENEHGNKSFLDKLCEEDKQKWDNKACKMTVKDGKLQLLCENGNVLAEADYYKPDNDTACCDEKGKISIKGFKEVNSGGTFKMWVGTQAEYDAIRVKNSKTYYWITDDTTLDDIFAELLALKEKLDGIESGEFGTGHAATADEATHAESADEAAYAKNADNATYADRAGVAAEATHATNADNAAKATKATSAEYATSAASATRAESANDSTKATQDSDGSVIKDTYGNFAKGWSSGGMSYPSLSSAGTYQVRVKVDYNSFNFVTSAVVYWDGESQTIINLPIMRKATETYATIYYFRLIISADGSTHVQYFSSDERNGGITDWTEIDYFNSSEFKNNVNIYYRKIL